MSRACHCLFGHICPGPCLHQEFPFLTLTAFPPGLLVHVGGVVSARSVKLLDRIHNPGMSSNTFDFTALA